MAVCELHFNSLASVGKMSSATVILPEGIPGPFPVFYLLHGLSDDHTAWVRRSSIERYVQNLPLIVVMPNGERGFYCDAEQRLYSNFETMIVRDLMGFVDNTFQTIPNREGRVIAGLSMGGYGAWKLALTHPDKFCAAVSHSGALGFGHHSLAAEVLPEEHQWVGEFRTIVGENPQGGPHDLFHLLENIDRTLLPALRFDCGTDDFLYDANLAMREHLQKLNIPHEYEEFPGGHTWEYWDTHVQETVKYFARHLKLER